MRFSRILTWLRNLHLVLLRSASSNDTLGNASAKGMLGKPPPGPISSTVFAASKCVISPKLSSTCRDCRCRTSCLETSLQMGFHFATRSLYNCRSDSNVGLAKRSFVVAPSGSVLCEPSVKTTPLVSYLEFEMLAISFAVGRYLISHIVRLRVLP